MLNRVLRSRLAVVLLAGALAASLTACGGNEEASAPPPAAQPSTTPSSSPTPSLTPTPTPNGAGGKYGDLTLIVRRPAGVKANATTALDRFQTLHESFAALAAGEKPQVELPDVATADVVSGLNALLAPQRKAKENSGGTLTVRVTEAQANARVAVVRGCFDQSKLVTIRPNGSRYVDLTVKESPTMEVRATVTNIGGKWLVTEYILDAKC